LDLDSFYGRHLQLRHLVEAGQTWRRLQIYNIPEQPETLLALRRLAQEILDPVVDQFGPIELTYCFASKALSQHIRSHIDPRRDQHAGHELGRDGRPICSRLGQAVDFRVSGAESTLVAAWIARNLPFDRLYFYGADRPLHVSIGPDEARAIITMLPTQSGRRVPRRRSADWLTQELGQAPT
jgi:hypothetical protein